MTNSRLLMDKKVAEDAKVSEKEWRVFANVQNPNTRYQIIEATDAEFPENKPQRYADGAVVYPEHRVGDKFVEFEDGLFATQDEDCIEWCERNYPMVVDVNNQESETLVMLARIQTPRQDYEPESSVDILTSAGRQIAETKASVQRQIDEAVAKAKAEWESQLEDRGEQVAKTTPPVSSTTNDPSFPTE